MKKHLIGLLCVMTLGLFACKDDPIQKEEEDLYKNVPSSKVSDQLADGSWFSGTLSAISYWDRDGHNLGNDYEAGREYLFYNQDGKGRIKFWQYLGMRTYSSCVTEIYTRMEGSVVFEGDKFTFYPVKGSFKTIKDKCSSGNGVSERKAEGDDLLPDVYRWEIRRVDGEDLFYTFSEDDVNHEDALFVYRFTQ
ncbi:hypothetical protein [Solitalea canadensis]|uniref:Uncharacterized protein n=1 Tax=Solitalea canadensis (strain ATCC 29591 / DSM 3403 / JCM 21819 / LMG 8368 / NBRC 15130 / NCIMB 12057 / USAM 9D) TaxID=929556 RepID=H8KRS3_SOLCM|nr:hypothetical protein [Solitalea canadensis]AFD07711.1 hypothetical protein Solca_2677 [Solitalea canadensis DSM 3403]